MDISVGIGGADIQGSDGRALQAAIDHAASLGGGTVHIQPGRYLMRNALTLRDNVHVVGVPGKSVLAACDGFASPLSLDGDCNERQITVSNPAGFHVGDGVAIQDDDAHGFMVTTATLMSQVDAHTFKISAPLYLDYMVDKHASAKVAFPVIGGWNVKNASVEGLTVEGNREHTQYVDGCRCGGIYLFECEGVAIRKCDVRNYNGDGISFQVSQHVTVEDCVSEDNAGLGLHPGSGSQNPIVRRNRSISNGGDGIYVCWRVKHGQFENNEVRGNRQAGISIGHKDTDNVFRHNTIVENGQTGVLFRNESEPMGAHRNLFEDNQIVDNGTASVGGARASIVIRGHHSDLVFRRNRIGSSSAAHDAGILAGPHATGLDAADNEFVNVKTKIASEGK